LRTFPLTRLKIDRSFTRPIADTTTEGVQARSIVRAAIDLARAMDLESTAEGVETAEQLEVLKQLYCDEVQGYFIEYPMKAQDVQAYLARKQPSVPASAQTPIGATQ
jgi:EAL domain-containing protein (putative c-di-GMP-specific phosphodiesterase class I)